MSEVTNLIISSSGEEEGKIINQLRQFIHRGHPFYIVSVKDEKLPNGWYGGSKYLECSLLRAYNHHDLRALVEHMRSMTWESPEDVQLIIEKQWDTKFKIIDLFPEEQ